MKKKLKCEVVTEQNKTGVVLLFEQETITSLLNNKKPERRHHIHFISNRPVQALDWFITETGEVLQCHGRMFDDVFSDNTYYTPSKIKKIEATTNPELSIVPKIPTGFIDKFVKGLSIIKEVYIDLAEDFSVKRRDNGTVIVSATRNTFTSEELNKTISNVLIEYTSFLQESMKSQTNIDTRFFTQNLRNFTEQYNSDFTQNI